MRVWATAARRPKVGAARGPPERMLALCAPALSLSAGKKLRVAEAGGSTEPLPAPLAKMASGAGQVSVPVPVQVLVLLLTHPTTQTHHTAHVCHEQVQSTQCSVAQSNQPPAHDRSAWGQPFRQALKGDQLVS